jgi:hypothetical protein
MGWVEKNTGIDLTIDELSNPVNQAVEDIREVGRDIDDWVNEEIPGGWILPAAIAIAVTTGYIDPSLMAAEGATAATAAEAAAAVEAASLASGATAAEAAAEDEAEASMTPMGLVGAIGCAANGPRSCSTSEGAGEGAGTTLCPAGKTESLAVDPEGPSSCMFPVSEMAASAACSVFAVLRARTAAPPSICQGSGPTTQGSGAGRAGASGTACSEGSCSGRLGGGGGGFHDWLGARFRRTGVHLNIVRDAPSEAAWPRSMTT